MLAGTEDVPRLGTAREVLKVEYEGRSLVVKRVHSSWVNSPDVDQRRARKLAWREQVAFDTVRRPWIQALLLAWKGMETCIAFRLTVPTLGIPC